MSIGNIFVLQLQSNLEQSRCASNCGIVQEMCSLLYFMRDSLNLFEHIGSMYSVWRQSVTLKVKEKKNI